MKRRKNCLFGCLALIVSLLAGGMLLTGETWAWPTVSRTSREQLALGSVDYVLHILHEDTQVSGEEPLEPGIYTVAIVSTGDSDGWFKLHIASPEGNAEELICRTGRLAPEQNASFVLELKAPAKLTVEPRWDIPKEEMTVIVEDTVIRWDPPAETLTEETTEAPTEVPTEATTEAPTEAPTEVRTEPSESEETQTTE